MLKKKYRLGSIEFKYPKKLEKIYSLIAPTFARYITRKAPYKSRNGNSHGSRKAGCFWYGKHR